MAELQKTVGKMLASNSQYLKTQLALLRFLGLSLREKEPLWYNIYAVLIQLFVLGYVFALYAVFKSYKESSFDIFLENLSYGAAALNGCVKAFTIYRIRKELGRALLLLESGVFLPNEKRGGKKEQDLINECTFLVNTQTLIVAATGTANFICSLVSALVSRVSNSDPHHWNLPYGRFAVFNITYSPNYEAAFLYEAVTVAHVIMTIIAVSGVMAGIMAYLAYQFRMLHNFILNFEEYTNNQLKENKNQTAANLSSMSSDMQWQHLRQTLKEIVKYHTEIINLTKKFEELLRITSLVDFVGPSFVICLALFTANIYTTLNLRLLGQLNLGIGLSLLQFSISYWANEVIIQSEGVSTACYEADFINTDIRFKKSWISIMQRSQKAIYFTVGNIAPLSLSTFLKVLQTAYSYFTVLHHLTNRK